MIDFNPSVPSRTVPYRTCVLYVTTVPYVRIVRDDLMIVPYVRIVRNDRTVRAYRT